GGGGTDVLWYSSLRGGAWISAAINKYVFIFLNKTEDPTLIKASHGFEAIMTHDYKKINVSIIRECLSLTKVTKGVEISTAADASARSGLGGSGAFEVGLLHALYTYKRKPVSQLRLAKEASLIEIEKLNKPVGPQDQYISALGGIKYFEIDREGRVTVESLNLSPNTIAELESSLLFFRTGIQRDSASVLAGQKKKVEGRDKTSEKLITALDEIKKLGLEAKKYLKKGKLHDFGKTFHEHWLIKKRLSDKVSSPKIDQWYNEALKAGALGGKIMGAGGGGWFVFYVPKNRAKFRERMIKIGLDERRVHFDWEGSKLLVNLS
ncbi:galactokinase, partial [Candidatus Gottesmanbacteria bacterium]|nr:galactokinase [Candidatus Gottesmanbacteria bacterium]